MENILTRKAVSYLCGKSTKYCALLSTIGRRRRSVVPLFVRHGDIYFPNELPRQKHFLSVAIALLMDVCPLPVVNNIRTAFCNILTKYYSHLVTSKTRHRWGRQRLFLFRKEAMPFLTVDAIKAGSRSTLLQHAPGAKHPRPAPTISSEKICCATKLLLPSFAPSYQTGLI